MTPPPPPPPSPATPPRGRALVVVLGAALAVAVVVVCARATSGPSVGALVAALARPDERTIAYHRLLERGPEAVAPLLEVAGDPAAPQRADALELLGRLRDPRALPVVLAAAGPELAAVRLAALGRLRGPEAQRVLLEALAGEDPEPKFTVLVALVDWPDPDGALRPAVTPYLRSEHAGLREPAAAFCGRHGLVDLAPELIGLLRDPEGSVRQAAARALMQLGTAAAVAAVDSAIAAGAVVPEEN